VIAYNVLQSIRLLADSANAFVDKCIVGVTANETRIKDLTERSLMLVTALAPEIGYDNATKIAKAAHNNGTTLREEAVKGGYVNEADYDRIVRPENMISPT
jgi:fumarate hydratase class II